SDDGFVFDDQQLHSNLLCGASCSETARLQRNASAMPNSTAQSIYFPMPLGGNNRIVINNSLTSYVGFEHVVSNRILILLRLEFREQHLKMPRTRGSGDATRLCGQ